MYNKKQYEKQTLAIKLKYSSASKQSSVKNYKDYLLITY